MTQAGWDSAQCETSVLICQRQFTCEGWQTLWIKEFRYLRWGVCSGPWWRRGSSCVKQLWPQALDREPENEVMDTAAEMRFLHRVACLTQESLFVKLVSRFNDRNQMRSFGPLSRMTWRSVWHHQLKVDPRITLLGQQDSGCTVTTVILIHRRFLNVIPKKTQL